eukprot:SM000001S04774  [mRNA]  locus=s1:2110426:2111780:+ [translate_table: standard]
MSAAAACPATGARTGSRGPLARELSSLLRPRLAASERRRGRATVQPPASSVLRPALATSTFGSSRAVRKWPRILVSPCPRKPALQFAACQHGKGGSAQLQQMAAGAQSRQNDGGKLTYEHATHGTQSSCRSDSELIVRRNTSTLASIGLLRFWGSGTRCKKVKWEGCGEPSHSRGHASFSSISPFVVMLTSPEHFPEDQPLAGYQSFASKTLQEADEVGGDQVPGFVQQGQEVVLLERWMEAYKVLQAEAEAMGIPRRTLPQVEQPLTRASLQQARNMLTAIIESRLSSNL